MTENPVREDAIDRARKAITDLAVATCNCPYESERELAAEVERLRGEIREARKVLDSPRRGSADTHITIELRIRPTTLRVDGQLTQQEQLAEDIALAARLGNIALVKARAAVLSKTNK